MPAVIVASLALLEGNTPTAAQDEPPSRVKVAALLNLPPWQSWVHLFCEKSTMPACAVTFRCGKQPGEPATWDIDVDPGRVFSYWSGKTNTDGRVAGLEVVLVDAGKTAELAPWGKSGRLT